MKHKPYPDRRAEREAIRRSITRHTIGLAKAMEALEQFNALAAARGAGRGSDRPTIGGEADQGLDEKAGSAGDRGEPAAHRSATDVDLEP